MQTGYITQWKLGGMVVRCGVRSVSHKTDNSDASRLQQSLIHSSHEIVEPAGGAARRRRPPRGPLRGT